MKKEITKINSKFGISSLLIFIFLSSTAFAQVSFDRQIEQFTQDLGTELAQSGKMKVAVLDFADIDGKVSRLGKVIAEDITVNLLSQRRRFQTIDRLHLLNLLKKYNLDKSSLTDPETIKQIGRMAGVDAIIMGNFTDFGTNLRMTGKIYDARTANIIRASKIYLQKEGVVLNLLGDANTSVNPNDGRNNNNNNNNRDNNNGRDYNNGGNNNGNGNANNDNTNDRRGDKNKKGGWFNNGIKIGNGGIGIGNKDGNNNGGYNTGGGYANGNENENTVGSTKINNFNFELKECYRQGTKVICNFMITNIGRNDKKLVLYASSGGRSFAYGNFGNRFEVKVNRLGNQQKSYSVNQMMIRNVPVSAQITFENVSDKTTMFNILELNMETFKVRFNKVQIGQ